MVMITNNNSKQQLSNLYVLYPLRGVVVPIMFVLFHCSLLNRSCTVTNAITERHFLHTSYYRHQTIKQKHYYQRLRPNRSVHCMNNSSLLIPSSSAFTFFFRRNKRNSCTRTNHVDRSRSFHQVCFDNLYNNKIINTAIPIATKSSTIKLHNSRLLHENHDNNHSNNKIIDLMKDAYENNETDGILQIAPIIKSMDWTGDELVLNALEAVSYNKGQAAGILNSLIASCRYQEKRIIRNNDESQQEGGGSFVSSTVAPDPDLAWSIYTAWEGRIEELGLYPDIITFCSTYSVMQDGVQLNDSNKDYYHECALQVLDQAERNSKKAAGSKRRRLLASLSRRKEENKNVIAQDYIETLQELYGEDFNVLFENDDVIVISKPSGMVCFHSHKTTDGKIRKKKNKKKGSRKKNKGKEIDNDDESMTNDFSSDISLEDALLDLGVQLSTLNPDAMGIVHRIDRGTSGTIVLAKNNKAHAKLVTNFFTRCAEKSYLALIPFSSNHTEDDNNNSNSSLDQSGVIKDEISGKPALSTYKIIESYGSNALLLEVGTKTGRKHQVRIHCAKSLGRPIFLDPQYSKSNDVTSAGKQDDNNVIDAFTKQMTSMMPALPDGHYFFLHALSLKIDEFDIDVTSEMPRWWKKVLIELKTMA